MLVCTVRKVLKTPFRSIHVHSPQSTSSTSFEIWNQSLLCLYKGGHQCHIPSKTSPATAISLKLLLKVSLIFETSNFRVGSHFACTRFTDPINIPTASHGKNEVSFEPVLSVQKNRPHKALVMKQEWWLFRSSTLRLSISNRWVCSSSFSSFIFSSRAEIWIQITKIWWVLQTNFENHYCPLDGKRTEEHSNNQ